jgi:hypothetical protein
MSENPKKLASGATFRQTPTRSHKFSIGAFVVMNGGSDQASFRVTGHLPDGGSGPQYKIKSERENYERVTTESRLFPVLK